MSGIWQPNPADYPGLEGAMIACLQVGNVHLGENLSKPDKWPEANTAHNVALLAELLCQWLRYQELSTPGRNHG